MGKIAANCVTLCFSNNSLYYGVGYSVYRLVFRDVFRTTSILETAQI